MGQSFGSWTIYALLVTPLLQFYDSFMKPFGDNFLRLSLEPWRAAA
jgi:hypothetical protein